jgi:hypothetical protein
MKKEGTNALCSGRVDDWPNSTEHGHLYAPFVMERYTTPLTSIPGRRQAIIYWLLSTWNPYQVTVMRTELTVDPGPCGGGTLNACGGCNPLFKPPGGWCEEAHKCGRWKCVGTNAVTCDTSTGVANECGGCSPMVGFPTTGSGRGDPCVCPTPAREEGILVCARDKNHLICCPCSSAPGCGPGSP